MKAERFMVTGTRLDNKKPVRGFVVIYSDKEVVIKQYAEDAPLGGTAVFPVNPFSIEPYAVPIIIEPIYDNGEGDTIVGADALCPDCEEPVCELEMPEFCCLCGQRLLWPERGEQE